MGYVNPRHSVEANDGSEYLALSQAEEITSSASQLTNYEMSELSQRLNLTVATFGALFCLTPLFLLKSEERYTTDDTMAFQRVTDNLLQRSPSLMASFFVVLIPAADLLLDLPHRILSSIGPMTREPQLKKPATRSAVFRLNEIERIIFMAGIGVQSCVWFMSLSENMTTLGIVYFTTCNSSILLILGPILSYLQRCTTTFTSLRVTVIVLIAVVGLMTLTISNFFRSDGRKYQVMNYVGMLILTVAGLTFGSLIATCAFKFCRSKLKISSDRSIFLASTTRSSGTESLLKARKCKEIDDDTELYTNYIPGLHMTASLIVIISYLYVGLMPTQYITSAYERKNYIVIVAEVIVLVIELRIRKNEIARGLVSVADHFAKMSSTPTLNIIK